MSRGRRDLATVSMLQISWWSVTGMSFLRGRLFKINTSAGSSPNLRRIFIFPQQQTKTDSKRIRLNHIKNQTVKNWKKIKLSIYHHFQRREGFLFFLMPGSKEEKYHKGKDQQLLLHKNRELLFIRGKETTLHRQSQIVNNN